MFLNSNLTKLSLVLNKVFTRNNFTDKLIINNKYLHSILFNERIIMTIIHEGEGNST